MHQNPILFMYEEHCCLSVRHHSLVLSGQPAHSQICKPTRPDMLGPFYKPNAPERSRVGEGYVLTGAVRSSKDCSVLKGAPVEICLAGVPGRYDDAHRATVFSDQSGYYRCESNFPPAYHGRLPHIHIRVSREGYRTLITQHYPKRGSTEENFDLVLTPGQEQ